MKILGLRNLFKSEILDFSLKFSKITIDTAILKDFSIGKGKPLIAKSHFYQLLSSHLPPSFSPFAEPCKTLQFRKNHLQILLFLLLQNRSKIRFSCVQILTSQINSQDYLEPCEVFSRLVEQEGMNEQEVQVVFELGSIAGRYAQLLTGVAGLLQEISLAELALALYCERAQVNIQPILGYFGQKQTFNRNVQKTLEDLNALLSNSKLASKSEPAEPIFSAVELLSVLKANLALLLDKVVDDLNFECVEEKRLIRGSEGTFEVLVDAVVKALEKLVQVQLQRMESFVNGQMKKGENVEGQKENEALESQNQQIQELKLKFENLQKENQSQQYFYKLCDFMLFVNQCEAFESLLQLEQQHILLKNDKRPKILPLGKGTQDIFFQFLNQFPAPKTLSCHSDIFPQFQSTFFNAQLAAKIDSLTEQKNNANRKPKLAKGTRDFDAFQMAIRAKAFKAIRNVFQRHGAVELDTPVFELKETLTGKYGEDSKLIYDLEHQGGELLSLRYDLTVPFARYVALKGIDQIKRFHIAKVYRRDQPAMNKGRFREFYQCDFDIAGSYDPMLPDAEVIKIMHEILTELDLGKFVIKLNHRKLLDAMIELSGASKDKFKQICSSIDKLDKEPWSEVERELIEEKGLSTSQAKILESFVQFRGSPIETLSKIEPIFSGCPSGAQALSELSLLFKYLEIFQISPSCSLDLSLARGLDYYTGFILEIVSEGSAVGSICGGGRYDELVGMFSSKQIPSCGASIGIERVLLLLEEKYKKNYKLREVETKVVVASIGPGMLEHKLAILNDLWRNDIGAEIVYQEKAKPAKQLEFANNSFTPLMVWIGENEIQNNQVKIKNMYLKTEEMIDRKDLIIKIQQMVKQFEQDLQEDKIEYKK